jgi:hypothetical protein
MMADVSALKRPHRYGRRRLIAPVMMYAAATGMGNVGPLGLHIAGPLNIGATETLWKVSDQHGRIKARG